MVSVIFNSEMIVSIVFLPIGEKFTKEFIEKQVINDFENKVGKESENKRGKREIKFHCDNSRARLIGPKLLQLNVPRLDHPPCGPGLAPCDFFLFGHLKICLRGNFFSSSRELVHKTTTTALRNIPQEMLRRVCNEWVIRLKKCIEINGEYVQ